MSYVSQDELETRVLSALFEYAQVGSGYIEVPIVCGLLGGEFSETRVKLALRALETAQWANARHNSIRGSSYEISDGGYRKVEADGVGHQPTFIKDDVAPAADRIVSFDHNSLAYSEIAAGLVDAHEAVRETNNASVSDSNRQRILYSLDAAQVLWRSSDLRVLQIKVGILMAVEDAAGALSGTAKAVGIALLIDTIKAFVKTHTGFDLDHI